MTDQNSTKAKTYTVRIGDLTVSSEAPIKIVSDWSPGVEARVAGPLGGGVFYPAEPKNGPAQDEEDLDPEIIKARVASQTDPEVLQKLRRLGFKTYEHGKQDGYDKGYLAGLEAAQQTAANVARVDGSAMAAVHAISELVEAAKKEVK